MRTLTSTDIEMMCTMYRDGSSVKEIAAHLNCSQATVSLYLRRNIPDTYRKLPPAPSHSYRWATDEDITDMLNLYRDGWSMLEIARRLGYHHNTVRHHIKLRVPPDQRHWPTKYGSSRNR